MGEQINYVEQFDSFFSTKTLKLMKLFLPYVDPIHRKKLILYIKFREWQLTLDYLSRPRLFSECVMSDDDTNIFQTNESLPFSIDHFLDNATPYLSEGEASRLQQFKSMMDNMTMYQELFQQMKGMGTDMPFDDSLFNMGDDSFDMSTLMNLFSQMS